MGSITSFLGASGCGKTTLQTRLGLLRTFGVNHSAVDMFRITERFSRTSRLVTHDIVELLKKGKSGMLEIESLRRRLMGFYLQTGELLPTLTIKENVAMPLRLNGVSIREANRRAEEILGYLLDNSDFDKLAFDSSGGEYQRIALARALAHNPQILFVDEPTSSLDVPNKRRVLDLMAKIVHEEKTTVLMINHDEILARDYSDFIVNFRANPDGWSDLISKKFRPCDGFGHPVSFEAKVDGTWVAVDPKFQFHVAPSKEEEHVA